MERCASVMNRGMKIKVIVRSLLPPAVRIGKVGRKEIKVEEKKGRGGKRERREGKGRRVWKGIGTEGRGEGVDGKRREARGNVERGGKEGNTWERKLK